ncbi:MAG: hypothetical protein RJB38_1193 [Pseudomonadota bacterium]|jgi:UDP-3-O-[3-hydroxymyristoyl] glucosamine N-acyltransferase
MVGVQQILQWTGGRVVNFAPTDVPARSIERMAPLAGSLPTDLCFFFSKEYQSQLATAKPGVLITGEPFVEPLRASGLPVWQQSVIIACTDPYFAMARVSGKFASLQEFDESKDQGSGRGVVHPTAVVHPGAQVAASACIGPYCVVEQDAVVGEGARLVSHVYLGRGSVVGARSVIFPQVTIYHHCRVGDDVRIHSGTVIGADGFGYAPEKFEGRILRHEKIYHFGGVSIGNEVEIGALSAVDRGTLEDTVIEDFVKIDNFVQVAHNSVIHRGAVMCGCSGVAGGSEVGRFAYLGGRATVVNKAKIGDGAMVGSACVVTKDVAAGEQVAGFPQRPLQEHLKVQAHLSRLLRSNKKREKEES